MVPQEIPSQITYGLLGNRHKNNDPLIGKLVSDIHLWMTNQTQRKDPAIKLFDDPSQTRLIQTTLTTGGIFKRDPSTLQISNDFNIITEALGIGCAFIATMNFRSIDHNKLNDWVGDQLGYNERCIGSPDDLSQRILDDQLSEALIIASMSVSKEQRSFEQETTSWEQFRLHLGWTFPDASVSAYRYANGDEADMTMIIEEGRRLAEQPTFKKARQLEAELQSMKWEALSWGLAQGICELTEHEQKTSIATLIPRPKMITPQA